MLVHEFKEQDKSKEIQTKLYLEEDNQAIVIYQYRFKKDKVEDINCIRLPILEFAQITKKTLASYVVSKYSDQLKK